MTLCETGVKGWMDGGGLKCVS